MAAGLGPAPGIEEIIAKVNFDGVVRLLEGWHKALAVAGNARVVIFSSNSTTTVPGLPQEVVDAFLEGDVDKAVAIAKAAGPEHAAVFVYVGSKTAITYWMRTIGVTPDWAGKGIRVNAIAPGAVLTPLLQKQSATEGESAAISNFPIPVGEFGKREEIAKWVIFMLSPAANFMCGSMVVLDGGTDAYFREDDWPRAIRLGYLTVHSKRATLSAGVGWKRFFGLKVKVILHRWNRFPAKECFVSGRNYWCIRDQENPEAASR